MHEASIALSMLDIITSRCRKDGYNRIDSVKVRIGRASGILPEALTFAFDAAKVDTIARDAQLIIESVPLGGVCNDCGRSFKVNDTYIFNFNCPECSSSSFKIVSGFEMDIIEIDVSRGEDEGQGSKQDT